MDQKAVTNLVAEILAGEASDGAPPPTGTLGTPWPAEKVQEYIEKLIASLVQPYLLRFELRETFEQMQSDPVFDVFWVVAEADDFVVWLDPATHEFGLGHYVSESSIAVSIGVRGDLVGVFCAI